ncbi:uncharacterized protein LOC117604423 [Osmia lignaria lignaria]|uniref:uncharacterized protein LOC117604423 n=1 Tax=Osmia lignaria lignaria TaxID=1437193 RepID=UPI00402B62E7
MQSSSFILFVLLTSAQSKSTTKHELLEPTTTEGSPLDFTKKEKENYDSGPVETLFVPEDPNKYEEILAYVRKLFERVPEFDQGILENPDPNETWSKDPQDQFSSLEDLWEKNSEGLLARTNVEDNRKAEITLMKRNKNDGTGPEEEDFLEAANFGLEAMNELYTIKEPMLYSKGIYLDSDNPARHVAIFNDQTEEARALAKYGFAVLQGTTRFKRKFPDAPTDSLVFRRSQSNLLQRHCPNRGVPICPTASLRYRTSDGSCNNLHHLWWGSAMSSMQRFLPPVYGDGVQSIRKSVTGRRLPTAREVTIVVHEDKDVPLASVTHMLMQWGQFVDHDLTATGQSRGFNGTVPQCCLKFGSGFQPPEFMHPECLPIPVSSKDSFFGPLGVKCLEFVRSGPAPKEDCEFGPREQLTQVTSYLDASTVYSSNAFQTDTLRLFRNGLLQYGKLQSQRPVLPKLDSDLCKRGSLSTNCFRAGDGRLGEQPALTSLHVAFLRLHNRIATKLAALNPHWSDEKLFQESRRIVGAIVQHITYREFLPIVLGQDVMKIFDLELLKKGYYEGYDPKVNPTIANEFSTAAYRFGHSLVQHSFVRFNSDHQPIFNNVSIHNELSNPANLETAGSVDRLLLGLINQPSQRRDEHISEELTNHLFQTPSFPFGMDLASINIQRGRDHGIPPYVQWREPCGLSSINSFDDLDKAMPPSAGRKFRFVYSSVNDIDLFSAGLAEKSVKGGLVGPTFACIIGQQFSNVRRGDRFWYENPDQESSFTPGQLQQIRRVSLAQVLCATMDNVETVQPFVFLIADSLKNQRLSCSDPIIGQLDLEFWAEKPSETRGRAGILDKFKRTTTESSTTKINSAQKTLPQILKPPKASIHQQNRIVVKKPLGPPDNVTIVVQNNAINSPIFVNDAIHGSSIKVNPSLHQQTHQSNSPNDQVPAYTDHLQSVPVFLPPRPIPTAPPAMNLLFANPYIPYAFKDPNNPNPLSQGFHSSYLPNDVVFESYPGSTPRPTLYTYYTNFHKTTEKPGQNANVYLVGYVPQDQEAKPTQTPWPRPDQLSRPVYDWQKLQYQQSSIDQAGQSNSQGYRDRPDGSIDSDNRYQSNKPYQNEFLHQSSVGIKEFLGTVNPNGVYFSSPSNKPDSQNDHGFHSTQSYYKTTSKPHYDETDKAIGGSYQDSTKPSKTHSVTIIGTDAMSQGGHEIDRVENRVTGEIPKPLISQINRPAIRKPGQYYYERNVLHRYPEQTSKEDTEERHKWVIDGESIDRSLINNTNSQTTGENDTIVAEIVSQSRNGTNDTVKDHVDLDFPKVIDDVASMNSGSHWLNPREDSSVPSALEVPKISSDDASFAKELPRPIKS